MPFWQTSIASSSSSSSSFASSATVSGQHQSHQAVERSSLHSSIAVSSMAKSFLPTRRRLRLDPSNKLFFPCMIFCLPLLSSSWFLWLFTVLVAVVVVFFFLFWGLWFLYDLVVLECVFSVKFSELRSGSFSFFWFPIHDLSILGVDWIHMLIARNSLLCTLFVCLQSVFCLYFRISWLNCFGT